MLKDLGLSVKYPNRTFATVDHIVPTLSQVQPFADPLAEGMINELKKNVEEHGIKYFSLNTGMQGIVVLAPLKCVTSWLRRLSLWKN